MLIQIGKTSLRSVVLRRLASLYAGMTIDSDNDMAREPCSCQDLAVSQGVWLAG